MGGAVPLLPLYVFITWTGTGRENGMLLPEDGKQIITQT